MDPRSPANRRGPVAYMARNGVAANLLMALILVAGVVAGGNIVQEVFPEASLGRVRISVAYPGATPSEVEEGIVLKIEERIESVEGLRAVRSVAAEGMATVTAEMRLGTDAARFVDDVKARVDRIQTFPRGAERPEVREVTNQQSAMQLAIFGDVPERALKELARRTEDALSALPEVSYVETSGVRDYEISIEVPRARLRALGVTLDQIASAVRAGSLDLSAGRVDTRDERVRIRTAGQKYSRRDFEDIVVLSRADGTVVRLGEIAEVRDGFANVEVFGRHEGLPAAYVDVFRTSDEKVLEIMEAVERELEATVIPGMPPGVGVSIWLDNASILESRLGLLLKNGAIGLVLVMIALSLFLEVRLAFWVVVGIAVSFAGTLALMALLGVTINIISLLGFILAIGIVVDDAIVVSENIHAEREKGLAGLAASARGARRIARPVVFAVLTTMVAFAPLLFVPGALGAILGDLPVIVISVLSLSLVESLLILPSHLSHVPAAAVGAAARPGPLRRIQRRTNAGLQRFVEGPLDGILRFATGRPGVVVAGAVALLVVLAATIPAGFVPIVLMPPVESDMVTARLRMPEGTPARRTDEVARRIEDAGHQALDALLAESGESRDEVLVGVGVTVGRRDRRSSPTGDPEPREELAHVASVHFRLTEPGRRKLSATDLQYEWRKAAGAFPEARTLAVSAELLDLGAPVHVQLSHPDPVALATFGDTLLERLRHFAGVHDVQAENDMGTREIRLDLLPAARTFGLTLDDLARQARAAFFGSEALRVQRGREEVRVYVRLPEDERNSISDLENHLIRTPAGDEVPLAAVASVAFGRSPSIIRREDGVTVLAVTAEVDAAVVTGDEVTREVEEAIMPELMARDPDLGYSIGGRQREMAESLGTLGAGFALALLAIYALLAVPFASYSKPLVIMAAIPFGLVGALLGHLVLGLSLAVISMFGMLGLSGVIVNDSLVMIDNIEERGRRGAPGRQAIIDGAKARFRPIFLTSVTTFLGVAPLVFETSVQAQFLVPMAAALGFGVLFGTVVLMMVVPSLAMVHHRVTGRA